MKRDLVRQWVAKADEDLNAEKLLLSLGTSFFSTIAFHCQQAVEKYCKAFLTWRQSEFPKTHDLELLFSLISSTDASLSSSLKEVAVLNPFGVDVRYPGDVPEITPAEAEEAVQLSEKAREIILGALDIKK